MLFISFIASRISRLTTRRVLALSTFVLLAGCTSAPEGVYPVDDFDLERYLGKWYEIARLDHSFERGLSQVTAQYSLREDGGVAVLNSGFDANKGEWKSAEGKAFFVSCPETGHLKVSFFGPFYGAYVIVELDPEYRYALVSGPNRGFLWILARSPELSQPELDRLIARAAELDFPTDDLIFVAH